jgi:hypothetical protein
MVNEQLFLGTAAQRALFEMLSRRLGRSEAAVKGCNFCRSSPASSLIPSKASHVGTVRMTHTAAAVRSSAERAVNWVNGSLRLSYLTLQTLRSCIPGTARWLVQQYALLTSVAVWDHKLCGLWGWSQCHFGSGRCFLPSSGKQRIPGGATYHPLVGWGFLGRPCKSHIAIHRSPALHSDLHGILTAGVAKLRSWVRVSGS